MTSIEDNVEAETCNNEDKYLVINLIVSLIVFALLLVQIIVSVDFFSKLKHHGSHINSLYKCLSVVALIAYFLALLSYLYAAVTCYLSWNTKFAILISNPLTIGFYAIGIVNTLTIFIFRLKVTFAGSLYQVPKLLENGAFLVLAFCCLLVLFAMIMLSFNSDIAWMSLSVSALLYLILAISLLVTFVKTLNQVCYFYTHNIHI